MKVGKEMRIMRRERAAAAVRRGKRPPGFTLIEIMVGLTVLLIAMAGLVPLFLAGFQQSTVVRHKSTATNIAREKMESIRQLDYRDIPADTNDEGTVTDEGKAYLIGKFGYQEDVRGVTYAIDYAVEKIGYGTGALKEVTVEVGWTAPPEVVPVELTTLFHQQYTGLRISRMEVKDPPPFPVMGDPFGWLEKDSTPTLCVYVAEDDWDLAYDNLNESGMAPNPEVYAKYDVVDEYGVSALPDEIRNLEFDGPTYLNYDGSVGGITDVYFAIPLDVESIPDGYWNFHAWAYNQYQEPGNRWTLRFRVENGAPSAPEGFYAVAQSDNESIRLNWSGAPDSDVTRYEIYRDKNDSLGNGLGVWVLVISDLDPEAITYLDQGDASSIPQVPPWGSETQVNSYRYRIRAWDDLTGLYSAWREISQVEIPDLTTSTTVEETTSSSTSSTTVTTEVQYYTISIENRVQKKWHVVITCDNELQGTQEFDIDTGDTATISGLLAGNYDAVATSPGKIDVVADWTLGPLHDPTTPVMILQ